MVGVGYSGIAAAKQAAMRWKQTEQNTAALQEEQARKLEQDVQQQAQNRKVLYRAVLALYLWLQ